MATAFFNGQVHAIPDETIADLKIVLDYVERYNKKDEDKKAAEAQHNLEAYLDSYEFADNEERTV
jgi:hypothetical protein